MVFDVLFIMIYQDLRSSDVISVKPAGVPFIPSIRSGSFADIGPRWYMEDEHIRIDDLTGHLGSMFRCLTPSTFYGVISPNAADFSYTQIQHPQIISVLLTFS